MSPLLLEGTDPFFCVSSQVRTSARNEGTILHLSTRRCHGNRRLVKVRRMHGMKLEL